MFVHIIFLWTNLGQSLLYCIHLQIQKMVVVNICKMIFASPNTLMAVQKEEVKVFLSVLRISYQLKI